MKRILYILLFLAASTQMWAQQPTPPGLHFKLIAIRYQGKVYLRWLLDNAAEWRYANEKGYILERAEEGTSKFQQLTADPIKPWDAAGAARLDSASNAFSALAFVLNPPQTDSMRLMDEQLYGFYFLASSYETNAAIVSGSGWVDSTALPGKIYNYRISVADSKVTHEPVYFKLDANPKSWPAAPALTADFGDSHVKLFWDMKPVQEDYFATVIERSEQDSLHFAPLSMPIVKTSAPGEKPEEEYLVNQTELIQNKIPYYFRIRGLNIFGLTGPASASVKGMGGPDLIVAPRITGVEEEGKQLLLEWDFPDTAKALVEKYEIWQSSLYDTGYIKIAELPAGIPFRQQLKVKPLPVNYFVVKAVAFRKGQQTFSTPFMYQLVDSVPPATPVALNGKIDSLGVVRLTWTPNNEPDLLGYRVLKSTGSTEEFLVMNANPDSTAAFTDTLPLNQLNKSVFYKVVALDHRYNESPASAFLELKRPDKIPPAPARLRDVVFRNGKIYVSWVPSFSSDVASYTVFRKSSEDSVDRWKPVATLKKTDTIYADKDIREKIRYTYSVQATDDGNLLSEMSGTFSATIPESDELKKGVKNFNSYVSKQYKYIELNWQDNDEQSGEYWLYRAAGKEKLALVATLPVTTKKYVDEDLKPSTSYRYVIKVVYKDGTGSKMENLEVAY